MIKAWAKARCFLYLALADFMSYVIGVGYDIYAWSVRKSLYINDKHGLDVWPAARRKRDKSDDDRKKKNPTRNNG